MSHIFADCRFALRMMRSAPGFYATLLAVLMLGIGATTAMFSIVDSVLLRPLPYPHPEELTVVWGQRPTMSQMPASLPDFVDLRAQAKSFQGMAAINLRGFSLKVEGARPEFAAGAEVTGDFFPLLGIKPMLGRLFVPEDDRVGAPQIVVVSAALWHRRLDSDPAVVGRTLMLDAQPYTIVGIAPEGFDFAGTNSSGDDVWTPMASSSTDYATQVQTGRSDHSLIVIGRRKGEVSLAQAQAELAGIAKRLEEAYPQSNAKRTVVLEDLHATLVGPSHAGIWVLFAAVSLVFLGVCANVSNLLLARAQTRRAEMAARAALGATSTRLAAQVLTETVLIFLLAALGGAFLSRALVDTFARGVVVGGGVQTLDVAVDTPALVFTVLSSLLCGLAFGLVPALALSRVPPQAVLKETESRAGVGRAQRLLRSALVVAQVAIAFALLVGSGLALRAYAKVATAPLGFDPESLATGRIDLPDSKYDSAEKVAAFYAALAPRLARMPGVESAGIDSTLPLAGSRSRGWLEIEGRPPWVPGEEPSMLRNAVTNDYFKAMRIPLLRGRSFTDDDRAGARKVVIISQSVAQKYFPGRDPIGQRIYTGEEADDHDPNRWLEIVGVVGDIRRDPAQAPTEETYRSAAQAGTSWMGVAVRAANAQAALKALPDVVQSIDPQLAVSTLRLMSDRAAQSLRTQRFIAVLLGAFALAALLLASLGLFGLVSYTTRQRTREFGIRMALGSTPEQLIGLVLRSGMRLVGLGLVVGLVGALFVGRMMAERMNDIAPFDLALYLLIFGVLGLSGLLACALPAREAVRTPPAAALRYE